MFETLLITNIFATFFMTGLIWFIQIVQYPGFHKVEPQNFQSFHLFHIYRVSIVVIPPMLVELGSSIWLTAAFDQYWIFNAVGLALVVGIWISTFSLQLPIHKKLQEENPPKEITQLVISNWIRTVLWSIKAGMGIYLLSLL